MSINLSASQIKALQCPRKWYFSYHERYEKQEPVGVLLFGQAFHHGMAIALKESQEIDDMDAIVMRATVAANEQLDELMMDVPPDSDISAEDFRIQLSEMFAYYIPLIGLGTKYRLAYYWEVMGEKTCPECEGNGVQTDGCENCDSKGYIWDIETEMVEYEFTIDVGHGVHLHGFVDAFLIDMETDEVVIVDWKTVASPRNAIQAMLDDQLHLYAAAFNHLGADIKRVIMWQMRKGVPKPAKINKNGSPSIAPQATTFAVWKETFMSQQEIEDGVEVPIHFGQMGSYDSVEAWAAEKLKPETYFNAPVENIITAASNEISIQNIHAQADMVRYLEERVQKGYLVPAIADGGFSGICMFCPFQSICVEAIRHGEDYQHMLDEKFVKRS